MCAAPCLHLCWQTNPADVIILEGILAFHDSRVRQLMHMRIFVDTGTMSAVWHEMKWKRWIHVRMFVDGCKCNMSAYTHTHGYQRIQVNAAWRGVKGIKMEAMGTRAEIGGHR